MQKNVSLPRNIIFSIRIVVLYLPFSLSPHQTPKETVLLTTHHHLSGDDLTNRSAHITRLSTTPTADLPADDDNQQHCGRLSYRRVVCSKGLPAEEPPQ